MKELKPVPEQGKSYHFFDDGKIRESRHAWAHVVRVIPFDEMKNSEDENLRKIYDLWIEEKERCRNIPDSNFACYPCNEDGYWLYAKDTDYFVEASVYDDPITLWFARSINGGWFSFNDDFWDGRLDVDGTLYDEMIKFINEWKR